jgi:histidyl-tRNA synthetase
MYVATNLGRIADQSQSLEELLAQAQAAGLVSSDGRVDASSGATGVAPTDETTRMLLRESINVSIGRRSPEQILARLMRKTRDATDPASFLSALELTRKLAQIKGSGDAVVASAQKALAEAGVSSTIIENLQSVIDQLDASGFPMESVTVDLSLARGLAYYTGQVFEAQVISSQGEQAPIGGGGRYDGLVKALGGVRDMPALGFAFNIEQIIDGLNSDPEPSTSRTKKG